MRSEKEPEIFETADIKSLLSIFMRPLFSNLCDCKTEIRAIKKISYVELFQNQWKPGRSYYH